MLSALFDLVMVALVISVIFSPVFYLFYRSGKNRENAVKQEEDAKLRRRELAAQQRERLREQREQYLVKILPNDVRYFPVVQIFNNDYPTLGIFPDSPSNNYLTNKNSNYMAIDDHHRISFPESKYGNRRQYYLTHIDFQPQYSYTENLVGAEQSNINGRIHSYGSATDTFFYDGFRYSGRSNLNAQSQGIVKQQGNMYKVEHPSSALLTLIPVDKSRTLRIRLNNMTVNKVELFKQYFLLGKIEQRQLGIA